MFEIGFYDLNQYSTLVVKDKRIRDKMGVCLHFKWRLEVISSKLNFLKFANCDDGVYLQRIELNSVDSCF